MPFPHGIRRRVTGVLGICVTGKLDINVTVELYISVTGDLDLSATDGRIRFKCFGRGIYNVTEE